jgi:hypothetical protein
MPTFNFPSSPAFGQRYIFQTRMWEWDGRAWKALTGPALDIRKKRHDFVSPYSYCGFASNSSVSESDEVWEITRIQILGDGSTVVTRATGVAWDDRLTATYT